MATMIQGSGPPVASRSERGSFGVMVVTMLLLGFPLILTAALTPKFEQIFRDFGVQLPLLTRVFINIGRAASTPAGWVVCVAAIVLIALPAATVARERRAAAGTLLLLAMIFAGGYFLLLVASLFGPLLTLIQSIQSKP